MPQVSIIIRTKDRDIFLRRALQDISRQTFTDFEVIVINDGGDETVLAATVSELLPAARILNNPDSVGRGKAWVQGLNAAKAPFIAVHDDDDTWAPDFLAATTQFLDTHQESPAVAVRLEVVAEKIENGQFTELYRWIYQERHAAITLGNLMRTNQTVPIATLYRKSALQELRELLESAPVVEDWLVNMQLARRGTFGFIDGEPRAYWHQRPEDQSVESGNSVIQMHGVHARVEGEYRDGLLRDFIDAGGLGHALQLGAYVQEITDRMDENLRKIEKLSSDHSLAIRYQVDELEQKTANTQARIVAQSAQLSELQQEFRDFRNDIRIDRPLSGWVLRLLRRGRCKLSHKQ
ncbi:glycosyltransferase family 2 protein [uncultured Mobiluncus sp.]|uniref:glycosyltransferase family 2 protein n=1 Tax=uncultured Mobiluncus sp. TaxID=293425 RepID=UPI0026366714|nr:glycosyltransferase family 2 protein [uncultured Mobiluncus sp.]